MVTSNVGLPFRIGPLNNIQPFTYRDGTSHMQLLERLRVYINDVLRVEFNEELERILTETNASLDAQDADFESRFADFVALTNSYVELINNKTGPVSIRRATLTGNYTVTIDPLWPTEHVIDFQLVQDGTGGRTVALGAGIIGGPVTVNTAPNGVTDFELVPTGTPGQWRVRQTAKQVADAIAGKLDTTTAATTYATKNELAEAEQEINGALGMRKSKHEDVEPEFILIPDRVTGPVGQRLNLPSHVTGNVTGEATHPSVAYRPEGWNGYPYWMAVTPYQGADDSMEDPNVLASKDGIAWVVPNGLTNPLDDAPGSPLWYNSDPDAVFGPDNKLYVFWRTFDPNETGGEEQLYYRCSADGVTWEPKVLVYQSNQANRRLISPSFVFEDGGWTCWFLDMIPSPFRIMRMRSTTAVAGSWSNPTPIAYSKGSGSQAESYMANRAPWHLSVIKAYGRYHMLVADYAMTGPAARDLIYMNSPDGIVWHSAEGPCIPKVKTGEHDLMYRATMIPAIQRGVFGFRVWYSAFNTGVVPNVWSVFRTFITDGPRTERGSFVANVPAAISDSEPAYIAQQINFSRFFKYTPDVQVSASTGFLGVAAHPIDTLGFQFNIDNTVQSARNGVTFYWTATEPE